MLAPAPGLLIGLGLAAVALQLVPACRSTVALGSECPNQELSCLAQGDGDTSGDGAAQDMDAGGTHPQDDAGHPMSDVDATTPEADAGAAGDGDAGMPVSDPPFKNGSFEITSDPPMPGDVTPVSDTQIDPWHWCSGDIQVGSDLDGYHATAGDSLIRMSFGAGSPMISQMLDMPLKAGQHYAFAVDAARGNNATLTPRLQLVATNATCTDTDKLAETPDLTVDASGMLTTYCFSFTPKMDVNWLALRVDLLTFAAPVFVDNLRIDPKCK